jgi:hypothetical protein
MMAPWTSRLIFFQRAPFSGCFWSPCWSLGCSERKFCLQQADGPLSMGNALEQRNHGISPTGESTDPRTVSSHELHVQLLGKSRGGLPSFADLTRAPRPDPAGGQSAGRGVARAMPHRVHRGRRRLAALLTAPPGRPRSRPSCATTAPRAAPRAAPSATAAVIGLDLAFNAAVIGFDLAQHRRPPRLWAGRQQRQQHHGQHHRRQQ